MLTAFDKAMVFIVAGFLGFLNQKFGYHFDTTPETLSIVIAAISSIIVYFVPNKVA
jgi:putative flippase GtrA